MSYNEYKEFEVPESVKQTLEKAITEGNQIPLGKTGIFEWLTKMSKDEGWRPVWPSYRFPFIVLERTINE